MPVHPPITVTPIPVPYKELDTQHPANRVFPVAIVDESPIYKVVMLYRYYNKDEKVALCQSRDEVRKKVSWLFRHYLRPFAIYEKLANGWKLIFEHKVEPFCVECGVLLGTSNTFWGPYYHYGLRGYPVYTPARVPYWKTDQFTHQVICARCKEPHIWEDTPIPEHILRQLIWRNNERPLIVRDIET